MVVTGTEAVHVWFPLHAPGTQTASPGSATPEIPPPGAGVGVPAVEDEYWVEARHRRELHHLAGGVGRGQVGQSALVSVPR